jgi:hypothetical protein
LAGGEHGAEGVDHIAESVDGDQDRDELRDVPGLERQVADEEQVQAEQKESGVPDIVECVDGRSAWACSCSGLNAARWLSLSSRRSTSTSRLMATMKTTAKATLRMAASMDRLLLTGLKTR